MKIRCLSFLLLLCLLLTGCAAETTGGCLIPDAEGSEEYTATLNTYFAGKVLFPDAFSDIDFRSKCGEIMEMMLGRDFFDEMEAGGLYYGVIEMGCAE